MTATRQEQTGDGAAYKVALALMKSPEADATIDVLSESHPDLRVVDKGTYYHLQATSDITVDLNEVSEELGHQITLNQWLVIMSTYTGRIQTGDHHITVTDTLPD